MIDTLANPEHGSRGWSAGGAWLGRFTGSMVGTAIASRFAPMPTATQFELLNQLQQCEADCDVIEAEAAPAVQATKRWLTGIVIGDMIGGAALGATGAAIGAPKSLRGRAALGAAVAGMIPFFGTPLAPVGAWVATAPRSRHANPMSPTYTVIATVLGLAALGGLVYAGTRVAAKRAQAA